MRLVTLNIWGGGRDWPRRREALRRGFASSTPDLVTLQEVRRTDEEDQARSILGESYELVHQAKRGSNGDGIATASRWPIGEVFEIELPLVERDAGFAATALVTEIAAPSPYGRVWLVNYLPSWRLNHAYERERQAVGVASRLEELVADRPGHVVVAGDLDADPMATSIRFWTGRHALEGRAVCYRDAWESAGTGEGDTFCAGSPYVADWDWPFRRIDYVLVRCDRHGGPTLAIAECRRVFDGPEDTGSDHYGVLAELRPPPAAD